MAEAIVAWLLGMPAGIAGLVGLILGFLLGQALSTTLKRERPSPVAGGDSAASAADSSEEAAADRRAYRALREHQVEPLRSSSLCLGSV